MLSLRHASTRSSKGRLGSPGPSDGVSALGEPSAAPHVPLALPSGAPVPHTSRRVRTQPLQPQAAHLRPARAAKRHDRQRRKRAFEVETRPMRRPRSPGSARTHRACPPEACGAGRCRAARSQAQRREHGARGRRHGSQAGCGQGRARGGMAHHGVGACRATGYRRDRRHQAHRMQRCERRGRARRPPQHEHEAVRAGGVTAEDKREAKKARRAWLTWPSGRPRTQSEGPAD